MKTKYLNHIILMVVTILVTISGCSDNVNIGKNMTISGIYPNPMVDTAILNIYLENEIPVSIKIADAYGRDVLTVIDTNILFAGNYEFKLNMSNQPSGVYNCLINCGGEVYIVKFSKYQ